MWFQVTTPGIPIHWWSGSGLPPAHCAGLLNAKPHRNSNWGDRKDAVAVTSKDSLFRSLSSLGSLSVTAIFLVAFTILLASMSRTVNLYDEGVMVTGAARAMAGEVVHRDFYANYGPAQFYILAALFKLFGPSILVARLWGALVKAAIPVAVYLLGKRVMPAPWSLVSCVCSTVWLSLAENTVWPAWPALLASIGSILILFTIFEKGSSVKRALARRCNVWPFCQGSCARFRDPHVSGCCACTSDIGRFAVCKCTQKSVSRIYRVSSGCHCCRYRSHSQRLRCCQEQNPRKSILLLAARSARLDTG